MLRAVPALYLLILVLFVTAGSLLTARTEANDPVASLPAACTQVPAELVDDLFPDGARRSEDLVRDGARYGRWLGDDGTVLIELRCSQLRFSEFGTFRDALAAAEAGEVGGGTLLTTEPAAVLAMFPEGSIIRQLDEETGLLRTWFVRDQLTPDTAEDIVERTLEAQRTSDADEA